MSTIGQFIDTTGYGGAERVVADLCRGLAAQGHRVVLFHFGNDWILKQVTGSGVSSRVAPARSAYRSRWTLAAFAWQFSRRLRAEGIEVLHSHLLGPVTAGAAAALLAGIPHVGTLHDTHLITEQPERIRLLRMASLCASTLVTVADSMRGVFRELSPDLRFLRVHNGIAMGVPRPTARRSGPFRFLAAGRLASVKGFDVLIDAAARVGQRAGFEVLIAGDGPERAVLAQRIKTRGVAEQVRLLGFRDDVPALLADADAYVLASRSEGLSVSVMEAMAAGLPCVLTDVGGNGELVEHGRSGLLVQPENPDALADALATLARDPDQAHAMGVRARERVATHFSMASMVSGYEAIYSSFGVPEAKRRERVPGVS